jgi:hypothetical protein
MLLCVRINGTIIGSMSGGWTASSEKHVGQLLYRRIYPADIVFASRCIWANLHHRCQMASLPGTKRRSFMTRDRACETVVIKIRDDRLTIPTRNRRSQGSSVDEWARADCSRNVTDVTSPRCFRRFLSLPFTRFQFRQCLGGVEIPNRPTKQFKQQPFGKG